MNKIYSIILNEIDAGLRNKSFTIMAFGVPLVALIVFFGFWIMGSSSAESESGEDEVIVVTHTDAEGYVDEQGFISSLPSNVRPERLKPYANERDAGAALVQGEVTGYYVIPEDFVVNGDIFLVRETYNPVADDDPAGLMRWVLLYNLLEGDEVLAGHILNPMDLEVIDISQEALEDVPEDCSRPGPGCESNTLVRYIPFIVLILFYVFIASASGLLIRGMGKEKENRVIEILLSSVHPRQMLAGKIVGLGVLGFLQFIAWVGTGFLMLSLGGQTFSLPADFHMPSSFLIWGLCYFFLGYAMYASLMAGAGALIPTLKEVTQASLIAASPLLVGYMIGLMTYEFPHNVLNTILSIFPLTAPVVMMMRLVGGGVPIWQTILSLSLMVAMTYLIFRAVAAIFHAQHLLSGQPFKASKFVKLLFSTTA